MESSLYEGRWNEIRGAVRERWGRLTSSDLDTTQGQIEKLIGLVQERYGYSAGRARREVERFLDRYGTGAGNETETGEGPLAVLLDTLRRLADRNPLAFAAMALVVVLLAGGLAVRPWARS